MPKLAYLIGQLNMKDFQQCLDNYGKPVFDQLTSIGAEFLVTSVKAEALEGESFGNWTVPIRFPSREAAVQWYRSADFAPLKQLHINDLSGGGNLVLVPGRDTDAGNKCKQPEFNYLTIRFGLLPDWVK